MTTPNLALPLLMMLLLAFGEILFRSRFRGETAPWHDVVFNLNSGHLVMWYFRSIEVLAYSAVLSYASFQMVNHWPIWVQWLFGIVAWDFCFYWMHRMHHKIPFLWAVHVIHHQGEHFNLSLGIRNSWYSSLSNFPFIVILAVMGLPVEIFIVASSIHYFVQFYNHNGLVGRSGILDKIMVTPLHHRVHHGMDEPYIDKNFGGTFLCWDKLFKTFQTSVTNIPLRFGTHEAAVSRNPFWANHLPIFKLLNVNIPLKSSIKPNPFSNSYIARAGFILFLVVINYVLREGSWDVIQKWWMFGAIVISTLAVGAASDGKPWGGLLWLLLTCLFLFLLLKMMQIDVIHSFLIFILCLHCIDTLAQLIRTPKNATQLDDA